MRLIQDETTKNRNYFRKEHTLPGPPIILSSVWWVFRGKQNQVHVSYKVLGEGQFRSPRKLCKWLDGKPPEFITHELNLWKERVNRVSDSPDAYLPDFFLKHQTEFIKWCHKTARQSTVQSYLGLLAQHVFPFFTIRMRESDVRKWGKLISEYNRFIEHKIKTVRSRNTARTALRRYLKFLIYKGALSEMPTILNEAESLKAQEKVLPGDKLPSWVHIHRWISSLPRGRSRWVITLCAAFGIWVSEALAARPGDLIGKAQLDNYLNTNRSKKSILI